VKCSVNGIYIECVDVGDILKEVEYSVSFKAKFNYDAAETNLTSSFGKINFYPYVKG